VLVSAALFAGMHMPLALPQLVAIAGIGAVLAIIYERTRSLVPCIVAHCLQNGFVFLILLVQLTL
jgi:membrane protease YdiL (CAAX protease family)